MSDHVPPAAEAGSKSTRQLLYRWLSRNFEVLVPKKKGPAFCVCHLATTRTKGLADIAWAVGCDIMGLDGSLRFECGGGTYNGGEAARLEFSQKIMPLLEQHYGVTSREVSQDGFWGTSFAQVTVMPGRFPNTQRN